MAHRSALHLMAHVSARPSDFGGEAPKYQHPPLRLAAVNVGNTQTALGAFYRRWAARAGKATAVTATARKLAVLLYHTLRYDMAYQDPGASYYEDQYRQRVLRGLRRRAQEFGYELREATTGPEVS